MIPEIYFSNALLCRHVLQATEGFLECISVRVSLSCPSLLQTIKEVHVREEIMSKNRARKFLCFRSLRAASVQVTLMLLLLLQLLLRSLRVRPIFLLNSHSPTLHLPEQEGTSRPPPCSECGNSFTPLMLAKCACLVHECRKYSKHV